LQTLQRQESFFPFISDWNQLPPPIVMSWSVKTFKATVYTIKYKFMKPIH
jgi:hypothetical protein